MYGQCARGANFPCHEHYGGSGSTLLGRWNGKPEQTRRVFPAQVMRA